MTYTIHSAWCCARLAFVSFTSLVGKGSWDIFYCSSIGASFPSDQVGSWLLSPASLS